MLSIRGILSCKIVKILIYNWFPKLSFSLATNEELT